MCENPIRIDDVVDRVHSHNSLDLSTKEGNEIPTALQRDQVQMFLGVFCFFKKNQCSIVYE